MSYYNLDEALEILLGAVTKIDRVESVSLLEADGRVLAEKLVAIMNLPPFDNSGMDGYAVRLADAGKALSVASTIYAGGVPTSVLQSGSAIKIMTGAPTPDGAEAVVPFEHTTQDGELIRLPDQIKANQNIKKEGEELSAGETIFEVGTTLDPAKIALIASQGIMAVRVFERAKITVISGGDEVVEPWQKASRYQIYNTNSIALSTTLKKAGFEASYASIGKDNLEALAMRVKSAIEGSDVVLTTGGISVGEADFTKKALEMLGAKVHFHGLNIKPGKPTLVATIGKKLVVALPGNPLSALANLHLLVLPALFKIQGAQNYYHNLVEAKMGEDLLIKGDRDTAIFGTLSAGRFVSFNGGKYGSGMLSPIAQSNAIVVFGKSKGGASNGELVKVISINNPAIDSFVSPINS